MIDVSQSDTAELSQQFAHPRSQQSTASDTEGLEEEDEAAWLQDVQAAGTEEVKPLQSGDLVMDIKQLR